MLPKIPYMMRKNKSAAIPIGTFNLSCKFNPGDIADSRGISARKFPYLTTKKGNESHLIGSNVLSITVFNNEIVTVTDDSGITANLNIDGNTFFLRGTGERKFATVNSKLVIFPDKLYYDAQDKMLHSLETSFTSLGGNAHFRADYIKLSSDSADVNGYGGRFLSNSKSFWVNTNKRQTTPDRDWYFISDSGVVSKTVQAFGIDDIELSATSTNKISTADVRIHQDNYTAFKIAYQEAKIYNKCPKLAAFDENDTFIGYFVDYVLEFAELGYENKDSLTGRYIVPLRDGLFENSNIENAVSLYWIGATSSTLSFEELFDGYNDRYVSFIDENNKNIIAGSVTQITANTITFNVPDMASPNSVYVGQITARAYGWGASMLTDKISGGDEIYFPDSNLNTGHYTVKEVFSNNIVFEDDETINNEDFRDSQIITIGKWNASIDDIAKLKAGDAVTVSGSSIPENNTTFVIDKIKGDTIYAQAEIFVAGVSTSDIKIERKIPDLDFICEKDNRLYGVSNKDKTIYVSALGDPTNMFAYEGVSTDSFAVAVGGEGDFTACCKYGDSVLFFKENKLYKLTGSYPAEFALYSYDVAGVSEGSEKSCVVINEALYYCGRDGIYVYTGGVPTLISSNFGEFRGHTAVGCTDGENYYVALWNADADDETYLFAYNTRLGIWTLEDKDTFYIDSVTLHGRPIFLAEGGNIYELNRDIHATPEWKVQFVPFYETIDGKKSYSRIVMRVSIPKESYMQIRLRFDGGYWLNMGTVVGKTDNIIPIRIPINRCDKFELELSGKGECTILDIMREYHVSEE